jgi:hypothetical protein
MLLVPFVVATVLAAAVDVPARVPAPARGELEDIGVVLKQFEHAISPCSP